jgi:hypothetical protein
VRAAVAREIEALDGLAASPRLFEEDLAERSAVVHALLRRVGDALGGRDGLRRQEA